MAEILTNIEEILQYIEKDESEMKGVIRPISRQRYCPSCDQKVQRATARNEGYVCPSCNWRPNRFYIDLWWKNKPYPLCSDQSGQPLDSYERTKTLLALVNVEIHNDTFDPKKYLKAEIEKYFFSNQIEIWIKGKEKNAKKGKLAPSSLKAYRVYVEKYYKPFFKIMDVRHIRTTDIKLFYQQLPDTLSLKYQKCLMDTLEQFLNTLAEDDIIDKKPSFKDLKITVPDKTPEWIDRQTQNVIISCISDARDKRPFIFLTRQGTRPSEARALKIRDLDLDNGTITVSRTFSDHVILERTKEKKAKERSLNPELIPMLRKLCRDRVHFPEEFVFINWRTGKPYNRNIFNRIWNDACEKAEIDIRLYNATRHSVGTQASRAGVPDSEIAEILNHCDDRMVKKHYVNKADLERQRVVFEKINKVVSIRDKKRTLNKP